MKRMAAMLAFGLVFLVGCGDSSNPAATATTSTGSPASATASTNMGSGWQEFTSQEGRYAVLIPGTPEEQELTAETGLRAKVARAETEGMTYMVIFSDLPQESLQLGEEEFFKQFQENVVAKVESDSGAKLEKSEAVPITLDGNPGRELTLEAKGQGSRMRIFLVGGRSYQVVASGSSGQLTARETGTFLDSFRLMK